MTFVATGRGVYRWNDRAGTLKFFGLAELALRDVAAGSDGIVFALNAVGGTRKTEDGGLHWEELNESLVAEKPTVLLVVPALQAIFLGTSPPAIYRCSWRGTKWEPVVTLHNQPIAEGWYAPGAAGPSVRTLAVAPEDPEMLFADIHVGGIVRSTDGGQTWESAREGLEEDVHEVQTSPANPQGVYAATADGFYYSPDQAASWEARNTGLERRYCRAIAVHAQDAETLLTSASPTPPPGWSSGGKRFGVFRSEDGGGHWELVEHGLHPQADDVIDSGCLVFSRDVPNQALCGYESGELMVSHDAGKMWQPAAENLSRIYKLVAV